MTDTDILAAIDAAVGCQWCGGELGDSPSGDFCGPEHQHAWHAQHVEPLPWSRDAAVVYVGVDSARIPLSEPSPPAFKFGGLVVVAFEGFADGFRRGLEQASAEVAATLQRMAAESFRVACSRGTLRHAGDPRLPAVTCGLTERSSATWSDGGVPQVAFGRPGGAQVVHFQHSSEGASWTTIHPDGTVTEEVAQFEDSDTDDLDDDGPAVGAYLETGEVLHGAAADEAYRRREDGH